MLFVVRLLSWIGPFCIAPFDSDSFSFSDFDSCENFLYSGVQQFLMFKTLSTMPFKMFSIRDTGGQFRDGNCFFGSKRTKPGRLPHGLLKTPTRRRSPGPDQWSRSLRVGRRAGGQLGCPGQNLNRGNASPSRLLFLFSRRASD